MNQLQMLKKALIAYVSNALKAIWSTIAHPLSIVGKRNCIVVDYHIYGNSVQDGTPTPETPIEIQSVGELTTKNLLDVETVYPDYVNDEGGITYTNKDFSKIYAVKLLKGEYKENTQYTFSMDYEITNADNNGISIIMFDASEERIGTNYTAQNITGDKSGKLTVTNRQGTTMHYVVLAYASSGLGANVKLTNMQLEEGAATEYEPYHKYKIPVKVRGKNTLNMSDATISEGYYLDSSGVASTNTSGGQLLRLSTIVVNPNTTYCISSNIAFYSLWFFDGSTSISKLAGNKRSKISFTTPENCNRLRVSFNLEVTGQIGEGVSAIKQLMLEIGEGDGIYEPYIEPQSVNIYANEPLRKVGDYSDYIDFKNKKVIRNIFQEHLIDIQAKSASSSTYYMYLSILTKTPIVEEGVAHCISNKFQAGDCRYSQIPQRKNVIKTYKGTTNVDRVAYSLESDNITDALAEIGDGFDVKYVLAEPTEEDIILPKLPQFQGTTIYEVQTEVQPSGMEVCYYE